MMKLLEQLLTEKGMWLGNFFCLAISIIILVYLDSLPSKTFGLSLGLIGVMYFGYKLMRWKWLEIIYPFVGTFTIGLGILALLSAWSRS